MFTLSRTRHRQESGYIMLTLTLMMALMVFAAAVIVPTIAFEIKRDREEEMIHRGVQYSRAVRAYYRKFGRYPTKIEDLESSNNVRFLRKRYKDPENCKDGKCEDFVLLHFGDVKLTLTGGVGGGTIPGANPVGGNGFNGPAGLAAAAGLNSNSPLGQNQPTVGNAQADPSQAGSQNSPDATGTTESGTGPDNSSNGGSNSGSNGGNGPGGSRDQLAGVTFGGGPIVGVASANKKDPTIREFNHKKKYNQWQFVYDPATDRGQLIKGPNQPQVQAFGQNGVPNLNGQQPGGINGLGTSPTGLQNSPNSPTSSPSGLGSPPPPSNPPQQQ